MRNKNRKNECIKCQKLIVAGETPTRAAAI